MNDRIYKKLNTSIQTSSNAKELLQDEEGNVEATIELRLPDSLFTMRDGPKKIDVVDMQTSKFRLSMENTPIAALPYNSSRSNSDLHVTNCQLDVYPYCILENNRIMPDPTKPLIPTDPGDTSNASALPYYKDHLVLAHFIYTSFATTPATDATLESITWVSNSQNYGFPKTSRFYPFMVSSKILEETEHLMNLVPNSTLERYRIENEQIFIKNIGTIQQMFEDAIESAITYNSTISNLSLNIYLVDIANIPDDISPKPDETKTIYFEELEKTLCLWKVEMITAGDESSIVTNDLAFACKPSVTLGEQSLTIAYDTAAFKNVVPVLWNTPYVNTWDSPEQMTFDKWRKEQWGQPPPKRTYKYNCSVDENGEYTFTVPPNSNCAPMNIIANRVMRDTFSFLPWIEVDLQSLPKYPATTYTVQQTITTAYPYIGKDLLTHTGSNGYGIAGKNGETIAITKYHNINNSSWEGEYEPFDAGHYGCVMYVKAKESAVTNLSKEPWNLSLSSSDILECSIAVGDNVEKIVDSDTGRNWVYEGRSYIIDDQGEISVDGRYQPSTTRENVLYSSDIPQTTSESGPIRNVSPFIVSEEFQPSSPIADHSSTTFKSFAPMFSSVPANAINFTNPAHRNFISAMLNCGNVKRWDLPITTNTRGYLYFRPINPPTIWRLVEETDPETEVVTRYYISYFYWAVSSSKTDPDKSIGAIIDSVYWNMLFFSGANNGDIVSVGYNFFKPLYRLYCQPTLSFNTTVSTSDSTNQLLIEPNIELTDNKFYLLDGTTSEVNIGQQEVTQTLSQPYTWTLTTYDCDYTETAEDVPTNYYGGYDSSDPSLKYYITGKVMLDGVSITVDNTSYTHALVVKYKIGSDAHTLVDSIYCGLTSGLTPASIRTGSTKFIDPYMINQDDATLVPGDYVYTNPRGIRYSNNTTYHDGQIIDITQPVYGDVSTEPSTFVNAYILENTPETIENVFLLQPRSGNNFWADGKRLDTVFNTVDFSSSDIPLLYVPPLDTYYYRSVSPDDRGFYYIVWKLPQDTDGNCDLGTYNATTPTAIPSILNPRVFYDACRKITTQNTNTRTASKDVEIVTKNAIEWTYSGNVRLAFTWNNVPMVVLSPIQSIVLTINGIDIQREILPINMFQPGGSSLITSIPVVENFYSLAQTLRDLHDELVVVKDTFDDTATYRVANIAGQERSITISAQFVGKDGSVYKIFIPKNGIFSLQLVFGISYYY